MATFLRRKLTKLLERDEAPLAVSLQREGGSVMLNKREASRYQMLFTMLDSDKDGTIGGQEGASFLRRSGLDTDALREIWRLASGGTSKPKLGRDDFLVACKLIAATQSLGRPDMVPLYSNMPLALADFHYDLVPDVSVGGTGEDSQDIRVTVGNPTSFGSGMDKHTRYQVSLATSLPQFMRKEVTVWRRFSDFQWLHLRMSTVFPAAILPLFPGKKMVGNTDDAFVRERAVALEAYVSKVATHPALNNSLDFIVFLDATEEGLEAAKRYIEEVSTDEAESVLVKGVDMVMNIATTGVAAPPLVIKADEAFVQACASHGATLARLSAACSTSVALATAQESTADTMADLGRALKGLSEHERTWAGVTGSTRSAVTDAAAAGRRAEALLLGSAAGGQAGPMFSSSGGASPVPVGDAAAAAAFAGHSMHAGAGDGSIAGMFTADFSDPYAAFGGGASAYASGVAAASPASGGAPAAASTTNEICDAVGGELLAAGTRLREQLLELDAGLFATLREGRDREAELGEAIKRRDAAIDLAQDANGVLARKKKAYSSVKPTDKEYGRKSAEAGQAVERAENGLSARKDELEKMTELLKGEMDNVAATRRAGLSQALALYATSQAAQARSRADAWGALLPYISTDASATEASKEYVAGIARKAEMKARSASQAAKKGRAAAGGGGYAGESVLAAGDSAAVPAGQAAGGIFADDGAVPRDAGDL